MVSSIKNLDIFSFLLPLFHDSRKRNRARTGVQIHKQDNLSGMIQKLASLLSTPVNTDQKERHLLNGGSKLWFSEGIAAYNPPKKLLEKSCSVQAACLKSENIFCMFQQLPALWHSFKLCFSFPLKLFLSFFFPTPLLIKALFQLLKKIKGCMKVSYFQKSKMEKQ